MYCPEKRYIWVKRLPLYFIGGWFVLFVIRMLLHYPRNSAFTRYFVTRYKRSSSPNGYMPTPDKCN